MQKYEKINGKTNCECACGGRVKKLSFPYGSIIDESSDCENISDRLEFDSVEANKLSTSKLRDRFESVNSDRRPSVSSQVLSALTSSNSRNMGRVIRIVVAGSKKVGKTACLQQLALLIDITRQPYTPTMDDTYQMQMDYTDRPKEIIVFHDTAGVGEYGPVELRKPYIQVADAFVLVYSVTNHETFNRMDMLKKFIDKQFGKDKKEVPIIVLGNMTDLPGRKVYSDFAQSWAAREKVKLYEVSAVDRNSLIDLMSYLASRCFHSQKESKFSLSKKFKPEKSNAAIMMDL